MHLHLLPAIFCDLCFQVAAPRNSSLFEYVMDEQPIMIYAEVLYQRTVLSD